MRKLGDIIMVNDIQRILNNMFDVKDKSKHHLFALFFNHPCNALLNEYFDLPNENNPNSIYPYVKVSNANIHWS